MSHGKPSAAITIYQPDQQGTGAFDGGRITEIKRIGFPGEGSVVSRVGPHRRFEIMSYVLKGELGHYATLGTKSRVSRMFGSPSRGKFRSCSRFWTHNGYLEAAKASSHGVA